MPRCHEILEDALRDTLSGNDDYGSHTGLAATAAEVTATREMLRVLSGLIEPRAPGLVQTGTQQLAAIDAAIGPPRAVAIAALPQLSRQRIPFRGTNQAGITTARQPAGCWASFTAIAASRAELIDLFKTLTVQARFLTSGGAPSDPDGKYAPPTDSGTLGGVVPADGLTITVGVGSTLFGGPFGIADGMPARLQPMQPFPNDDLDPTQTGGDLLLQICGGSPDTVIHALRQIAKVTRGGMQLNWRYDGFASPVRPTGVPRNHFAFKDGIVNPDMSDPAVANRLLWVMQGGQEPTWTAGGTYHVVRIIKQFIEFWDRASITEQQQMIGRFRGSGAPLGGQNETDIPDDAQDPAGSTIPLTAHIRLSNPRTKATEDSRIFRRGYNYDLGLDLNGNPDMGLLFNCFCQDLDRQFVAVQRRLIGEPMVDYISPVAGGYFFALPGMRDKNDWYASALSS
ncbi:MAG TPA: Dyp-type peroxidase [Solirubrobacteraceae bacterium]|nr:Dyp-type peroxidase [Solirubrobacteraceae bacterium]